MFISKKKLKARIETFEKIVDKQDERITALTHALSVIQMLNDDEVEGYKRYIEWLEQADTDQLVDHILEGMPMREMPGAELKDVKMSAVIEQRG